MKLELEKPYSELYKSGYIVTNPENRKNVILVRNDNSQTTTSYARYLMGVKLGYIVPDEFEVDHKDDDKTNDHPDNLQLLTPEENRNKEISRFMAEDQELEYATCEYCKKDFFVTPSDFNKRSKNKTGMFCSKNCSGKFVVMNNPLIGGGKTISEEDKINIKNLRSQGKSSYKIAEQTGFARNTIMKYWT